MTKPRPSWPASMPIVFVVDDDVSVRESLELMIRAAGWHPVLLDTASAFFDEPVPVQPHCLLLDVNLPDIHGLDVQARIRGDRAVTPIIFITGYGDVPLTVRAMKAGAVEVLTKPYDVDVLLKAVGEALQHSGDALHQQRHLHELRALHASLTPREREVMQRVVAGHMNKRIALDLGISEITVKAHRGKVMRKMRARSLADLIRMAATVSPDSA